MRISKTAAFYLQASIILMFLASSSVLTPLYGVYQAAWGFTPVTITVVFGVYALAVLAALLTVGSLSDHIGRRPVLLAATVVQAATMIVFATAPGLGALLVGRILQGLATGAAAGAVGAGLLDLDRARGATANAVTPMIGTALGSLGSGLMVQYLPAPTHLVYLVLAAVFVVQAFGVAAMPESVTPRPGALASLRPKFALPRHVRGAMLVAAPAMIAAWALAGFYGSLGPALVRTLSGSHSVALGGVTLFILAASGAATSYASRNVAARIVILGGSAALVTGVAITLLAIGQSSVALLFAGGVVAGAGFGASFQGAIRTVIPLATPHERAGVLSIVYAIAYLAMGVPAVLGGLRVHGGGLISTANEYGFAVIALGVLALAGTLARSVAARPRLDARAIARIE